MFEIEDVSVVPSGRRTGFTSQLAKLLPGQSFIADTTYPAAFVCIRQAKARRTSPLVGEFRVVQEGKNVRVGRVS